jgi:hypothetical protein
VVTRKNKNNMRIKIKMKRTEMKGEEHITW